MSCNRRTYLPPVNANPNGLPNVPSSPGDWDGMQRLLDRIRDELGGNPQNAPTPGIPQNLTATTLSGGTLLQWQAGANSPFFILYRNTSNNLNTARGLIAINRGAAGSQFFDACGQEAAGTRIFYWVQGFNGSGIGGPLALVTSLMVDCGGGSPDSSECDSFVGEIPTPTGAITGAADARTVATPDADFVTMSEITTPIAIYGPITIDRAIQNTAGQAATFRLYINDVLVDERAHTFTASASVSRAITLGWRAPGDVGSDGNAVGVDYADFAALGSYNSVNVDDVVRFKHMPFAMAPNKIKITMKATAATVSSTYTARYRYHAIAYGNPSIWTGQVRSYRASRSLAAAPGGVLDSDYVSTLSITTPGQLIGLAHGRITAAVVGSAVVGVRLKINGQTWDTFENTVSAANVERQIFGTTLAYGANSNLDIDTAHIQDSFLLMPSVRFSTLEMLTKFVSRSGGTTTATARVFALVAPIT